MVTLPTALVVWSSAETLRMPLASMSKVTSTCGTPRFARSMPRMTKWPIDWARVEVPAAMASVAALKVPLLAEVGVGHNWDEAH